MNNMWWIIFILFNGFVHMIGTMTDDEELGKNLRNFAFAMYGMVLCFMLGGVIN